MKKIFVDTSGWYAFLNQNADLHSQITQLFDSTEFTFITSNFITTELFNLLVSRRQKNVALAFGNFLREKSDILISSIDSKDEEEAWKIFQKYKDKDFSFTDCTSFSLMQRLEIKTALALDDDFVQMGFQVIPLQDQSY